MSARWMQAAERAAAQRCAVIEARIARAIEDQAPDVLVEAGEGGLRVRGRGIVKRWLAEPVLRFAARIGR